MAVSKMGFCRRPPETHFGSHLGVLAGGRSWLFNPLALGDLLKFPQQTDGFAGGLAEFLPVELCKVADA